MMALARISVSALILMLAFVAGRAVADPGGNSAVAQTKGWRKGALLVQPKPGLAEEAFEQIVSRSGGKKGRQLRGLRVRMISVPPGAEDAVARGLEKNPNIDFVEKDYVVEPAQTVPNDPYYGSAWHLAKIAADSAWDYTIGDGITVAILDTGVDPDHPDLLGKLVSGYNSVRNSTNLVDTVDIYGHGTMVAGTVGAASNNAAGVASVAWNAELIPIRITDDSASGIAFISDMSEGLTWAADHGANVANLSYHINEVDSVKTFDAAAAYMRNKGGIVVVAAGNTGTDRGYLRSYSQNIIFVSATTSSDTRASWSSYGDYVDLSAPGVGIWTTKNGGGYGSVSGTSFASPITAGVVALIMSADPGLTPAEVESTLEISADDLGAPGWDPEYGYGRVNAANAVLMALGGSGTPIDRQAPSVTFEVPAANAVVADLVPVSVTATDNTGVTEVVLYADGQQVAVDDAAPFDFSWDSTPRANGDVTLSAHAFDAAGNEGVGQVVAYVANGITPGSDILQLTLSTDNADAVYVNGQLLGSSSNWQQASSYTVPLQSGENVIAVKGMDAGGVAAFIAALSWSSGSAVSDGTWKVATTDQAGWTEVGFDDSGWVDATTYGAYGISPWGTRVTGFPTETGAQWIWSANSDADNTVYLRYRIMVDGDTTNAPPAADFSSACAGLVCTFTDASTDDQSIASWSWSFGDGGTSTQRSPSHTYAAGGTYAVSLTVTDGDGADDTAAKDIPVAEASDNNSPVQLQVALSTDNADEVYVNGQLLGSSSSWQVGSSYTVSLQSGENVIAVKGMDAGGVAGFIASLSWTGGSAVSDGGWKVATTEQTGWTDVGFDDSGWVNATTYGAYGVAPWGTRVAGFPAGTDAQWIWTSNNDADNTVYLRFRIMVGSVSNPPPIADFTFTCAELTCTFADASTDDGSITSWSWDFGDGGTSTQRSPSHSYAGGGSYSVRLTVTDDGGVSDTKEQTVTVTRPNTPPTAAFDPTCTDLTCTFTDQSFDPDGHIVSWVWDFGDGNGATVAEAAGTGTLEHTYSTSATYKVSLTVTDDAGAEHTTTQDVPVTGTDSNGTVELELTVSTDNAHDLYVNGQLMGTASNWNQASSYTVSLHSGQNVIAVKGMDAGGVAAFIANLSWSGGSAVSDASWKVTTTEQPGWADVGFDDSAWTNATTYGAYGASPWGTRVAGFPTETGAQWIWSSKNAADNVVYLRYRILIP